MVVKVQDKRSEILYFSFIFRLNTASVFYIKFSSVQYSCSVMSSSLRPHESQPTRPLCPSPTPRVHPNSCASSRWCHLVISSSVVPFSSCPQSLPSIRVFSNESALCMKWPKYWSFSFSISPSNEHPGLISFRMDWLDLLAVQGTQESSPPPQFKSINSSVLSFLDSPTLTSMRVSNKMGKTRDLFKKIRDIREYFMQRWAW